MREPLDDGEGDLPNMRPPAHEDPLIFDEALYLIKIRTTDHERAERVHELFHRDPPVITRETAFRLHDWIRQNPI